MSLSVLLRAENLHIYQVKDVWVTLYTEDRRRNSGVCTPRLGRPVLPGEVVFWVYTLATSVTRVTRTDIPEHLTTHMHWDISILATQTIEDMLAKIQGEREADGVVSQKQKPKELAG